MGKVRVIEASKQSCRQRGSFIENQLRVAAYCRVSTDSDEQKLSYQSQVFHYKQLVETKPAPYVRIVVSFFLVNTRIL